MKEHAVSSRISRDIVNLLISRGMNASKIAHTLGVSKSFVSRVKTGTRNFTLNHLAILEEAVGQSLPLLLIEAIPTESFSPEQRRVFASCRHLLQTTGSRRQGMRREPTRKHRSSIKAA